MKRSSLTLLAVFSLVIVFAQAPVLVKDIRSGSNSSNPGGFFPFAGKLIFSANDGVAGAEMWKIDGGIPNLAYDIVPGSIGSGASGFAELNNIMFFSVNAGIYNTELYQWDGISAPAMIDLNPGPYGILQGSVVVLDNKLYFKGRDSAHGMELWVYDPVTNTPSIVTDLVPGTGSADPLRLSVFNNKLYFAAPEGIDRKLYVHDPIANSTKQIDGPVVTSPHYMAVFDSKLYFVAHTLEFGLELYTLDHDTAKRLTDIHYGSNNSFEYNIPGPGLGFLDNSIYFKMNDIGAQGFELYKYDITTGAASKVHDFTTYMTGGAPEYFATYKDKLYFAANNYNKGFELWSYDGTNTPQMVADIYPGSVGSMPRYLTVFDDALYFVAQTNNSGLELFRFEDTTTGIQNVNFNATVTVYPNPATSELFMDMQLESDQYFSVNLTDITGRQVYATGLRMYSAGTNKITIPVHNLPAGTYYYNIVSNTGANYMAGNIVKQ